MDCGWLSCWVELHPFIQLFQFPVHMPDHFQNNLSENMFVVLAIIIMPGTSVWQRGVNHPWDRPQVKREDVNSRRWSRPRHCSRVSKCGNNFTAGVSLLLLFIRGLLHLLSCPCSSHTNCTKTTVVLVPILLDPKMFNPDCTRVPEHILHPPNVFSPLVKDSSGRTLQLAQSHVRNCFLVLTIGHPHKLAPA